MEVCLFQIIVWTNRGKSLCQSHCSYSTSWFVIPGVMKLVTVNGQLNWKALSRNVLALVHYDLLFQLKWDPSAEFKT